jgi:hypothetical protein
MEVSGQLHTLATLILGRDPNTLQLEGWVGLRANLDVMVKTKIFFSCTCWESNLSHPAHAHTPSLCDLIKYFVSYWKKNYMIYQLFINFRRYYTTFTLNFVYL